MVPKSSKKDHKKKAGKWQVCMKIVTGGCSVFTNFCSLSLLFGLHFCAKRAFSVLFFPSSSLFMQGIQRDILMKVMQTKERR